MTDLRKLQKLIDEAVKYHNKAIEAEYALSEYCAEHYGFQPGDVDADEIIDGVLGGCGLSAGMSAEYFDKVMVELTEDRE